MPHHTDVENTLKKYREGKIDYLTAGTELIWLGLTQEEASKLLADNQPKEQSDES